MARQNHTFSSPVCQAPVFPKSEIIVAPSQFALMGGAELAILNQLPGSAIRVYLALALHANPQGYCWPGRARLATLAGMKPNQVSKALTALEHAGLVTRLGNSRYQLSLHLVPKSAPPPRERCLNRHPEQTSLNRPKERAAPDETRPPTPEPVKSLSIADRKTLPPDAVPDSWLDVAQDLRPDLSRETISASGQRFVDYHLGQGTKATAWLPLWRNWIRRERGEKKSGTVPKQLQEGRQSCHQPYAPTQRTDADRAREKAEWQARMERLSMPRTETTNSKPLQSRLAALRQAVRGEIGPPKKE